MDLYEYQGKQLFKQFGIPVSDGRLASTPEEARRAAEELGGQVVFKAQVLTGGRGKAGGVKLAEGPADAEQKANDIIGLDIRGHVVEDAGEQKQIADIIGKLYRCFVESDAMLTEINPLIVTPDGEVKALDSKFTVDDSALYRHADIAEFRDTSAADPLEAFAREKGVTYVKLDGEVGILGNGAGLSMSTVDVVVVAGGRPANFCELGGGGRAEGVAAALEAIT